MLRTSSYSNQHRLILYITHIYPLMGGSRVTSSQRQWDSSACSLCTPSSEEQDGSRIEFSLLLSKYCLLNFAFLSSPTLCPKLKLLHHVRPKTANTSWKLAKKRLVIKAHGRVQLDNPYWSFPKLPGTGKTHQAKHSPEGLFFLWPMLQTAEKYLTTESPENP